MTYHTSASFHNRRNDFQTAEIL
uniref:Uncharacterized protein n=1 Tax=Anguilla anguilla TaxID=7936 RepID=A0A0E9T600_ANGAN